MKKWMILVLFLSCRAAGQELYVFSEPASNMPARSMSIKQTAKFLRNGISNRTESRHTTELMFGMSSKLMLHIAGSLSDMYSSNLRFESIRTYAKYRFFSSDDMYRHFRMAVFAEAAYSRNKAMYDELSLDGDQGGIQAGVIATQLLHRLALSSTLSLTEVLQGSRWDKTVPKTAPYEAFNYSLSAGYLVLPKKYTSYSQTNLNLYLEMIGQKTLDLKRDYLDLAPAVQLIFNSEAKLNFGYRFQLAGNMNRMSRNSWLIGAEWQILNVLR
jgi:hypothetical protein